jgi:hypothetical protein
MTRRATGRAGGKPDVTNSLPGDYDAADWRFLKPILEAYIVRRTGAGFHTKIIDLYFQA